jgi:hypothetical protein
LRSRAHSPTSHRPTSSTYRWRTTVRRWRPSTRHAAGSAGGAVWGSRSCSAGSSASPCAAGAAPGTRPTSPEEDALCARYVEHDDSFFFGGRPFTIGDLFLSRQRAYDSPNKTLALFYHERHHRRQWAVPSVIGGPLAFPIAYTVDAIFLPRTRNHFEQEVGLERGGYDPDGQSGPRLGFVDVGLLIRTAGAAELVWFGRRWRRSRHAADLAVGQVVAGGADQAT